MAQIVTLTSFTGDSNSGPFTASLIADSSGNLFGTTFAGGADGKGTVFELVKTPTGYSTTPTTLVTFNGANGSSPQDGLFADAAGNLYGTTAVGGTDNYGTVFEIEKTATGYSSTPTTLVSFNLAHVPSGQPMFPNGAIPLGGLIADRAGNLYGTTGFGGASGGDGLGTVFEIVKTATGYSNTPTILVSFDARLGANPVSGLYMDADGNLFGTSATTGLNGPVPGGGTPGGDGTIYEIAKTATGYASTPTILARFTLFNAESASSGLVADQFGNLFGTTVFTGSSDSAGRVFEIEKTAAGYTHYPSAPPIVGGFKGHQFSEGGVIVDAAGNLYGTDSGSAGTTGKGEVYKIVKTAAGYDPTPIILATFDGTNGGGPESGLLVDAAGNLFGTTQSGGANGAGTIFEVTGSGFVLACFLAGTRLLSERGQVPVEALEVGERVVTLGGQGAPLKAIRWIGRSRFDAARHPIPRQVWPIRIRAGALGEGLPQRDLLVSPGHSLLLDGVLVQAERLLNGATIVRDETIAQGEYFHVEVESHDILLSEGVPSESYLDTGNRAAFANGGHVADLHPDFSPKDWTQTCVPLVLGGPALAAIKARLLRRARQCGHRLVEEPDLHVVADGRPIAPLRVDERQYRLDVPSAWADPVLISRHMTPSEIDPSSFDSRRLGVCVTTLQIDGRTMPLEHLAALDGWYGLEWHDGRPFRWTNGAARLPPGGGIMVELIGTPRYWGAPDLIRGPDAAFATPSPTSRSSAGTTG